MSETTHSLSPALQCVTRPLAYCCPDQKCHKLQSHGRSSSKTETANHHHDRNYLRPPAATLTLSNFPFERPRSRP